MRRAAGFVWSALLCASLCAHGQEPAGEPPESPRSETADEDQARGEDGQVQGDGISAPKTMAGMSILGNEEAPKALVIIPWKSSELGDDIDLSDTLDERAVPVDREVFLRELSYYRIREDE